MNILTLAALATSIGGAVDEDHLQGPWCLMETEYQGKRIVHREQWQFFPDGRIAAQNIPEDRTQGNWSLRGDTIETTIHLNLAVTQSDDESMTASFREGRYSFQRGQCENPEAITGAPAGP